LTLTGSSTGRALNLLSNGHEFESSQVAQHWRWRWRVAQLVGPQSFLNPSVIPSETNKTAKTPTSATRLFLNSKTFPSVIQSVTTNGKFLSVFTDWITDGKVFVGFYRLNYGRKVAVGNFDLKIPTENIPSVNPLVFSEFLVVCPSCFWTRKVNRVISSQL